MLTCQRFQELSHRAAFAALCLFQTAADDSHALKKLLVLNEPLVGVGALNNDLSLAVDGQHGWRAGLFELGDMVAGVALKIAQGVDVREVHGHAVNLHEIACSDKRDLPPPIGDDYLRTGLLRNYAAAVGNEQPAGDYHLRCWVRYGHDWRVHRVSRKFRLN